MGDRELERRTVNTVTTARALHAELGRVRDRGYAVDDEENEPGVNCLAVPAYLTGPSAPSGAISVSALTYRTPTASLVGEIDTIRRLGGSPR